MWKRQFSLERRFSVVSPLLQFLRLSSSFIHFQQQPVCETRDTSRSLKSEKFSLCSWNNWELFNFFFSYFLMSWSVKRREHKNFFAFLVVILQFSVSSLRYEMFQFHQAQGFVFCEDSQTLSLLFSQWTTDKDFFQVSSESPAQHLSDNNHQNNNNKKKSKRKKNSNNLTTCKVKKFHKKKLHSRRSRPSSTQSRSEQHERDWNWTKVRNILQIFQIFILVSDRCLIRWVEGVLKNKVSSSLLQNNWNEIPNFSILPLDSLKTPIG